MRLADGRRLRADRVHAVLNRLRAVPAAVVARAVDGDRAYVEQEWRALLCSALGSLPARVVEPPHPYSLGGRWRSPAEWVLLAARAGLPTSPWRWEGDDPPAPAVPAGPPRRGARSRAVLVVAGAAVRTEAVDEPSARACEQLAALTGSSLLHVELGGTRTRDGVAFAGVTQPADPRVAGEAGLDALAGLLR